MKTYSNLVDLQSVEKVRMHCLHNISLLNSSCNIGLISHDDNAKSGPFQIGNGGRNSRQNVKLLQSLGRVGLILSHQDPIDDPVSI